MKALLALSVAAAFALPSFSQDAPDGSMWSGGGESAVLGVADTGPSGGQVTTQVVDASGFSNAAPGMAGPNSCSPVTASSSGTMTTPGGDSYRIKNGKLQRRISGKPPRGARWVDMRKVNRKGKKAPAPPGPSRLVVGDEITSLPLGQGGEHAGSAAAASLPW